MNMESRKALEEYVKNVLDGDLDKAETSLRECIAYLEVEYGDGDERLAPFIELLAGLLWCTNRRHEACELAVRAIFVRQADSSGIH
jgi:hypothetical protein